MTTATTTAYTIGTHGGVRAVALTRSAAAQYAADHYNYPVDIVGVPLILEPSTPAGRPADTPLPRAAIRVRRYDPGTSFDAALQVTRESARTLYTAIWEELQWPATDETLIGRVHGRGVRASESGIRSRRAELESAGWVRKTGGHGRTRNNRDAALYQRVEPK